MCNCQRFARLFCLDKYKHCIQLYYVIRFALSQAFKNDDVGVSSSSDFCSASYLTGSVEFFYGGNSFESNM